MARQRSRLPLLPHNAGRLRSAARRLPALLLVALVVFLAGPAGAARPSTARAAGTPAPSGMLITASATAEALDAASASGAGGGIVVRFTLANRTGADVGGLSVRASVPDHARPADSWLGAPGRGAGTADAAAVVWRGLAVKDGQELGPFAYRLLPEQQAGGADTFRAAQVAAALDWSSPATGHALAPPLRLHALWGEGGLRRTLLPSGLTVLTRERPDTPTVALRLAVRAGARDEDAVTCGGSHWLEHAHFLGTTSRPDNQAIFHDVAVAGGQMNATTGEERTDFWNLVPAASFDVALNVLVDQMLHSTFRPDAFNRERLVVVQEHKQRNDNPAVHADDEFQRLVFQAGPLHNEIGSVSCLGAISIDTILAYRAAHYVTGNMVIAASGNLRHDEAVGKIAAAFAALPRGSESDRPMVPEPPEAAMHQETIGTGSHSVEIRLGWSGPGADDPDAAVMAVIDDVLGSGGGRLSSARDDSGAYAVRIGSDYLVYSDAGALRLNSTTQPDQIDANVKHMLTQLDRLRAGDVTEADVQVSVRALAGQRALSEESNLAQTGGADAEVADSQESRQEFLARLRAITAADVRRVAQKYFDPDHYTLVVVHS